jgi:hypothetical protein
MTVTDALRDLAAQATSAWMARGPRQLPPDEVDGPGEPDDDPAGARAAACPPYPPYWLVRSWSGAESDEIGRGILERAIYVSPQADYADHATAVEIITDALCRWAHPDDIRWCHLPDAGTGGYTIVGTAIRSVSEGEGCALDDEDLYFPGA